MSAWRLNVAAVLIALAMGLVWLSSMPGRAFKAEEARLATEGYTFLPLSRIDDPFAPKSLYLTCRGGILGLSAVVVMPARKLMREDVEPSEEAVFPNAKATIFLNREPNRLGSPKLETRASFILRRTFDLVTVNSLDKVLVASALLVNRADRLSLIALEQGVFFPLKVDPGSTRAFLDRCA